MTSRRNSVKDRRECFDRTKRTDHLGRVVARVYARVAPEERFWRHVAMAAPDECWLWTGGQSGNGFGKFRTGGKGEPQVVAHRFAYETANGEIPAGVVVSHHCDGSLCVNPSHLFLATQRDKAIRCVERGRMGGLFKVGHDSRRRTFSPKPPKPPKVRSPRFMSLVGQRFERLVVEDLHLTRIVGTGRTERVWRCKCDCGAERYVSTGSLRKGNTKSCGCFHRDMMSKASRTHGLSKTSEYQAWARMISRCRNPKTRRYERYGGRGIDVKYRCFEEFFADVGFKPSPRHSVDRINNDGHYAPGNCRWALPFEQMNNTSRCKPITFDGQSLTVSQWAKKIGMKQTTLRYRLIRGWPIDCAILVPHHNERATTMQPKRRRDSVKARRICFETHRWQDHLGRWRMTCHLNKCHIDPIRDRWRADHNTRWSEGGEDTPENLWPICEKCDREEKAPQDTKEVAKNKRVHDRHYGIKRAKGFYKPQGAKFNWERGRYVKEE